MKRFLAVYIGTSDARARSLWDALGADERAARQERGMQAWGDWMAKHASAVVEAGGPLGKTKRAGSDGVTDTANDLVGYVVVQAESHQQAAEMFLEHPHFAIFPGDSVEVMECLPIPNVDR